MIRLQAIAVAAGVLAGASSAAAQSSVADGVAALARGEYERAAEILRPLAEREPAGDPIAQFFLGSMFESGLGVPRDPLRACALNHRASMAGSPFGEAAMRLTKAAFRRDGAELFAECQLIGNMGFDHRFEPAVFNLGPGHSIAWGLRGATVTYQGKTTFREQRFGGRGTAFLPLRYTPLETPRRVRHFIEVFAWQPAGPSTWALNWHLFEVVGSNLLRVASDEAVATSPARPPAHPLEDARLNVVVRTTALGQAEWAILSGPSARSEPIESEEERGEIRDLEAAERAALGKVDWNRRFDPLRTPSLNYAAIGGGGCGSIYLYALTSDRDEAIVVHADRQALQLGTAARSFDIARNPTAISVEVTTYSAPVRQPDACSDARMSPAGGTGTWRAVAGRMTIELSPPGIRAKNPGLYRATIRIDDVELIDASGRRHRQTVPIVLSAVVGSGAG